MCNSPVNVFVAGCYDDRKNQLKQLFRNLPAQQKAWCWSRAWDGRDHHGWSSLSFPHIGQQQFPLLAQHKVLSFCFWRFPSLEAWMKYFIVADTRHKGCWLLSCPSALAELTSVQCKKIKGPNAFCTAIQSSWGRQAPGPPTATTMETCQSRKPVAMIL